MDTTSNPISTLSGICDKSGNVNHSFSSNSLNVGGPKSKTENTNAEICVEPETGTRTRSNIGSERSRTDKDTVLAFARITALRFRLLRRSRILNDVMVAIGIFGLLLSIVVNQLISSNVFGDDEWNNSALIAMRCVITLSTLALLVINVIYQVTVFKLWFIDIPEKPFLVAVRIKWILGALFELLLCLIHPIPWDFNVNQVQMTSDPPYTSSTTINVNVFLTIGMCVRLYLVFRAILQHHSLYNSVIVHIFGPMNRVNVGYNFLFKVIMDTHAGIVVVSMLTLLTLTGAWMEMHCESDTGGPLSNYLNALWFTIVTFTTVYCLYSSYSRPLPFDV